MRKIFVSFCSPCKISSRIFIDRLRNYFDSVSSDEVFEYLKNHNNPTTELFIETQKKLAKRYYENENWERVISVYKLAPDNIKLHDGDSLFMYGYALYEANNERLNNLDAEKIFDIAASKGNKDATVMKEIVYSNPVYVGSDATIKYGLMKYSDNMYAQYIIGYIYEEIRHEPALAKEWYEKAANQGHKSAIRRLEPFLKEEKRKAEEKAAADRQFEQQTEFSVVLESFETARKIGLVKTVCAITDLSLNEAMTLVGSAPKVLMKGVSKDEADRIIAEIEAAGGKASKK